MRPGEKAAARPQGSLQLARSRLWADGRGGVLSAYYSDVLIPRTGVPESPLLVLCPPALQPLRPGLGPLPPAFGHLPARPSQEPDLRAPTGGARHPADCSGSLPHHVTVPTPCWARGPGKGWNFPRGLKKTRWREGGGYRASCRLSRPSRLLSAAPSPGGRKYPLSFFLYLLFHSN